MIVQFEFVKPGKGQALYKCKLKNMLTGAQFDKTYRSGEKFKPADLEEIEMEYLYYDGSGYCFMNSSNYEQEMLSEDQVGDEQGRFSRRIRSVACCCFKGRPIGVTLPNFVELRVLPKPSLGPRAIRPAEAQSRPPWRPAMWFRCRHL